MVEAIQSPLRFAIQGACRSASQKGRPVLAVAGVSVPTVDLLSLFARYSSQMDASLWLGLKKKSLLGLGVALECTGHGADRFTAVSAEWHTLMKNAVVMGDAAPVALGGFRFDAACPASSIWLGFTDGVLVIPQLTIFQDGADRCHIVAADHVPPDADAAVRLQAILSTFSMRADDEKMTSLEQEGHVSIFDPEEAKTQWHGLVNGAMSAISQGSARKIVAARAIRATSTAPFTVPNIVRRLRAENSKAAVFAFGRRGAYFVGATPEILITASAGSFQTMALAGSAPRSENLEQDALLGQALLDSDKDQIEHDFVVQAMLRALKPYCRKIVADSAPSLHKLRKVQHLVTHFSGDILPHKSLLDVVARLHPTPAVGGVPTESALAFLREHEGVDRGWYAGPVGWLDADGNGEFMVALRSGVIHRQSAVLFAGCGLVAGSDPVKEYQETRLKFSTMLDGLCPARNSAKAGGHTTH